MARGVGPSLRGSDIVASGAVAARL